MKLQQNFYFQWCLQVEAGKMYFSFTHNYSPTLGSWIDQIKLLCCLGVFELAVPLPMSLFFIFQFQQSSRCNLPTPSLLTPSPRVFSITAPCLIITILHISHFRGSLSPPQKVVLFTIIFSVPRPAQRLVKKYALNKFLLDE